MLQRAGDLILTLWRRTAKVCHLAHELLRALRIFEGVNPRKLRHRKLTKAHREGAYRGSRRSDRWVNDVHEIVHVREKLTVTRVIRSAQGMGLPWTNQQDEFCRKRQ